MSNRKILGYDKRRETLIKRNVERMRDADRSKIREGERKSGRVRVREREEGMEEK